MPRVYGLEQTLCLTCDRKKQRIGWCHAEEEQTYFVLSRREKGELRTGIKLLINNKIKKMKKHYWHPGMGEGKCQVWCVKKVSPKMKGVQNCSENNAFWSWARMGIPGPQGSVYLFPTPTHLNWMAIIMDLCRQIFYKPTSSLCCFDSISHDALLWWCGLLCQPIAEKISIVCTKQTAQDPGSSHQFHEIPWV